MGYFLWAPEDWMNKSGFLMQTIFIHNLFVYLNSLIMIYNRTKNSNVDQTSILKLSFVAFLE